MSLPETFFNLLVFSLNHLFDYFNVHKVNANNI